MFKARDVRRALLDKGFKESKRDHRFYFFYHDGRKSSIFTKISRGATDIDDRLCSAMARQTRLTTTQFRNLVGCPLSNEEYVALLIGANYLRVDH